MAFQKSSWQKRELKFFSLGALIGFVALSIALASVPRTGRITDDTAIYKELTEISVPKEPAPNFDRDLQRLSQLEPRYHENIAISRRSRLRRRIYRPLDRINHQAYRYSGRYRRRR